MRIGNQMGKGGGGGWVIKTAEFDADFESVEKMLESSYNKITSLRIKEFCRFPSFVLYAKDIRPLRLFSSNFSIKF